MITMLVDTLIITSAESEARVSAREALVFNSRCVNYSKDYARCAGGNVNVTIRSEEGKILHGSTPLVTDGKWLEHLVAIDGTRFTYAISKDEILNYFFLARIILYSTSIILAMTLFITSGGRFEEEGIAA